MNEPEINFWPKIHNINNKICNFNKLKYKIIFFYHNSRNDISCDDELIYQPPNKIIKYDNDIISTNFCNSDENSIG